LRKFVYEAGYAQKEYRRYWSRPGKVSI
jgi:hypothetical protein